MADCIWVQYEPAGSVTPYEGFINATVSGDDQRPPQLGPARSQASFPVGTSIAGMQIDSGAKPPTLIPILPENIPPPSPDPLAEIDGRLDALEATTAQLEAGAAAKP